MDTIQERAERLADSLVETVAKAGYLPQNRTYTSLEIKELADGLAEEIAAELTAAVDAERERQEWLWCAALINALKMDGIQKVVDKFLEYREFFDGWTVEQMRNQARGIAPKREKLFAAAIREGDE